MKHRAKNVRGRTRRKAAVYCSPIFMLGAAALLASVALSGNPPGARAASVCPALGADTDCGVIISVTDSGATISVTGQGPYDGSDDTLVGVVNQSTKNLPVSSLKLTSDNNIFGFDGDGIDTYGAPGNAKDSTGYGGPNAYFTNISADQTSGTVNFVTPIPPGGTAYFGLENSVATATSCQDAINGTVKPTATGANIDATFTPNDGLSLDQAAALCGFKTFDWMQKDTKHDDPTPLYARNLGGAFNSNVKGPVHLTSKSTPWSDPPAGGGYYSPTRPNEAPDYSYPFYYDPNVDLPPQQAGGMIMKFHDAPNDPCRFGGGWANTPNCANSSQPPGSFASYVTHLAGVNFDGTATDLGIGFTWNTNYNGSTGGVYGVEGTAGTADGNGTGGVTITSVTPDTTYQYDGLAVGGVNGAAPGPAGSLLVYSGPQALPASGWVALSAQLSATDSTPLAGRQVTLTLGTGQHAHRCTGLSAATGGVTCWVQADDQPLGPDTVTASFQGGASYSASTTSYQVIMYDYTRDGSYVVGDVSAGSLLPGPAVTYWSTQWAQQNKLSGGPAPASFDGFGISVAPPSCRDLDQWVAPESGGHDFRPPGQLPAYTAIIVSSDITTTHQHLITGNETHIVIIATSSHTPGTGTIVADLC
jgi:hypothetical protein